MKAMILAAGLGTRLKPLTNNTPKALIEVAGKPMIERVIEKLGREGFNEIIINVHHFAEMIIEYIDSRKFKDVKISFSNETDFLLETGGGILKASWFLKGDKPFLVYNVDTLTDLNLNDLYNFHLKNDAIATLAVRKRRSSRYFLINKDNLMAGWHNEKTGESVFTSHSPSFLTKLAFSGIHVISPEIFDLITEKGRFSITSLYLRLAKAHKIMAYIHNDGYWYDLGKRDQIVRAEEFLLSEMEDS